MARRRAATVDEGRVDAVVQRVKAALRVREAFEREFTELQGRGYSAAEVILIAERLLGIDRPKSREAALRAIGQERVRLAHQKAKVASAAKNRMW